MSRIRSLSRFELLDLNSVLEWLEGRQNEG